MRMKFLNVLLLLLLSMTANAQTGYLPFDNLAYDYFERQAVINQHPAAQQLGLYPISRNSIYELTDSLRSAGMIDEQWDHLYRSSVEFNKSANQSLEQKGIWNTFYKTAGRFLNVDKENFGLVVNPMLRLKYSNSQESNDPVFYNTRGVDIRGHIDSKVFFESRLFENQASFPDHAERRMTRDTFVQGNGFHKVYTSDVFNINSGYDFLNATGRFGFNVSPSIEVSYGYDKNFIGSGFRSLLLSDFSNNYSNLRIKTKVWKIQYQNIFAEFFNNGSFVSQEKTKERKYFSGHYLKFNFTPNIHIGFFEGVIYSGELGLQPALINPIIFYRSIEGFANRDGNAMLGADFRINAFQRFSLYGQVLLDEFKFDEVFGDPPGWWANKFGAQLGLKYFNVLGINNLDGFVEANVVRPYTYGHRQKVTSYTQFNQPLAHPLGANFKEVVVGAKYYFKDKWIVELHAMRMSYGEDSDSTHWGTNILIPNTEREQDYFNTISQGIDTDVWLINLNLSYQFGHNLFLDLEYNLRNQNSDLDERDYNESYVGFGLRMNLGRIKSFY